MVHKLMCIYLPTLSFCTWTGRAAAEGLAKQNTVTSVLYAGVCELFQKEAYAYETRYKMINEI